VSLGRLAKSLSKLTVPMNASVFYSLVLHIEGLGSTHRKSKNQRLSQFFRKALRPVRASFFR